MDRYTDPPTARAAPPYSARAACAGHNTDLWYRANTTRAKAICRRCPVQAECLQWAIHTGQHYGIWGGKTADERRANARETR